MHREDQEAWLFAILAMAITMILLGSVALAVKLIAWPRVQILDSIL